MAASSGAVGSSAFDLMDCMRSLRAPLAFLLRRMRDAGRRRGQEIADRQAGGRELANDLTALEHQSAVTDLRHLFEIGRDQDYGGAFLQGDIEQPIDLRLGADV